ncbi:MAG: ABC transporter permease [Balneolaceae bacterium]
MASNNRSDGNRTALPDSLAKEYLSAVLGSTSFNVFLVLIGMSVVMTFASDKFLSSSNLFSVARAFSFIAIMAIGQCLVIISGGVDLSVGSIFGLSGVVAAFVMGRLGMAIPSAILLGVGVGVLFGLFNALLITKARLPPFIATLGNLSVARGFCYVVTKGYPITGLPDSFLVFGQGYIGLIPNPVIILVILTVAFTFFLKRTVTGRRIFALGSNEEAARVSGINTVSLKFVVYALAGALAGFAGILSASRLGIGQPTAGISWELDSVAAVIIGGASLSGGTGSVIGAVLGAAIMGVLRNALVLLSVSAYWQQIVIGSVILLAVSVDQLRKHNNA